MSSDHGSLTTHAPLHRSVTDDQKKSLPLESMPSELPKDVEAGSMVAEQDPGVTKIEALYIVFGRGWKIWLLYLSVPSFEAS